MRIGSRLFSISSKDLNETRCFDIHQDAGLRQLHRDGHNRCLRPGQELCGQDYSDSPLGWYDSVDFGDVPAGSTKQQCCAACFQKSGCFYYSFRRPKRHQTIIDDFSAYAKTGRTLEKNKYCPTAGNDILKFRGCSGGLNSHARDRFGLFADMRLPDGSCGFSLWATLGWKAVTFVFEMRDQASMTRLLICVLLWIRRLRYLPFEDQTFLTRLLILFPALDQRGIGLLSLK